MSFHQVVLPNNLSRLDNGDQVRIAGVFKSYSANDDSLTLTYLGHDVNIHTDCIQPMNYELMDQIEVFGTVNKSHNHLSIDAKIIKRINDVDLRIYEKLMTILNQHCTLHKDQESA